MRVGEYLFQRLKAEGVTHTFGIPGDYALSLYDAQESCGLPTIVMTHEPSVGYAADVYARLKGLGVALVTYGVGALNMVNAVAMAYAEQSPVLVITGAPEVQWQDQNVLFYHRVKSSETQLRVYQEVTAAQASIRDPVQAATEIDRVLATIKRLSRPGFIEIARDIVNCPIESPPEQTRVVPLAESEEATAGMREALTEILVRLKASKQPVLYAGVEIERFGLMREFKQLVDRTQLPVATSLLGKAVLPEHHPSFIGTYFGSIGPEAVRKYLEGSDCVLALGMLMTMMDMGIRTGTLDRRRLIQVTTQGTSISYHHYPQATLAALLNALLQSPELGKFKSPKLTTAKPPRVPETKVLTMDGIIAELNAFLSPAHIVLADTGDCLFASVELRADYFIGPGYYASMGLAVPGAIGAQIARPDLRPVVLVGDGAFKMDGIEVATARDYGLNPIIVLINNRTYATLKVSSGDRSYFRLRPWDYVGLAQALGGQGVQVRSREEFHRALRLAEASQDFWIIDAVIDEADTSATLRKLGQELRVMSTATPVKRSRRT